MPRVTRRVRKELAADLRSFPFGRYVIFNTPVHDGIAVVRVLHSARDNDAAFLRGTVGTGSRGLMAGFEAQLSAKSGR